MAILPEGFTPLKIYLDKDFLGIIGRVHPNIAKDDIYVLELSLTKLYSKKVKQVKYKEVSKYPSIVKDLAFVVDKNITSLEIINEITKSGGRLLSNVDIFDIYTGDKIDSNKKSIAFSLTFMDESKTLTDNEVMDVFNKIINDVSSKLNAEIRDK